MEIITKANYQTWERFYRANFINSLTGFKSINLIGTKNQDNKSNLGIFSSLVHIGSDPALVGYINRPIQAAPHTLANIKETGFYTINHVCPSFIEAAHQTSAKYDEGINEFDEVGLHEEYLGDCIAPFVKESKIKYALQLREIIPITLNNTFLVIGEIQTIKIEDDILQDDGFLHIEKSNSLASNGTDSYYSTSFLNRYKYAKPGIKPLKL